MSALALLACGSPGGGGTAADPPRPSGGGGVLSSEEGTRFCVSLHEQMATCAAEFIDMNIELRARYFPSFAAKVADPRARAELREEGIQEALTDGTGPLAPRRERCEQYVAHGPAVPSGDAVQARRCFERPTCAEKLSCLRPSQEQRYIDRAKDPSGSTPDGSPRMN